MTEHDELIYNFSVRNKIFRIVVNDTFILRIANASECLSYFQKRGAVSVEKVMTKRPFAVATFSRVFKGPEFISHK